MAATGQLKSALLSEWPDECFRQLFVNETGRLALASSLQGASADRQLNVEQAHDEVVRFLPEVVYYRPVVDRHPKLHILAREIFDRHAVPVVAHIMDDWPSRLAGIDADRALAADQELREVFSRSSVALSISEEMSAAFQERYGVPFIAIANGVDLRPYDRVRQAAAEEKQAQDGVVLRYVGAVAKDMVFTTLVDVARAIDALQGELPVRFEVFTRHPWAKPYRRAIRGLTGTTVLNSVPGPEYPWVLASADILLIAYNFDSASVDYIRYSMPNKLPECLASGAALLAIGPSEATAMRFVKGRGLAYCLTEPGSAGVQEAIDKLARDPELRASLSARGTSFARTRMNIEDVSARFRRTLLEAADNAPPRPLVGPYSRAQKASVREGEVVEKLLRGKGGEARTMLDVGAHQGGSLQTFAEKGWRVVACEPDVDNRAKLEQRFGAMPNVAIDPRAVGDARESGVALYTSADSTGITSLNPFHSSHSPAHAVDVTTVAELFDQHELDRITFLKIDAESLDLMVLRGVPWERVQPEVIECEFEDSKTVNLGYGYRDMADYLVERNYAVYLSEWHPIVRYGVEHQLRQVMKYPCEIGSEAAWGNLLAFRTDPGESAVAAAFRRSIERMPGSSATWIGSTWPRRMRLRKALRRAVSALRRAVYPVTD